MKKLVAAFLILLFTLPVFADGSILLGTSTSLESKIMAENRPYMVYLPPSDQNSTARSATHTNA